MKRNNLTMIFAVLLSATVFIAESGRLAPLFSPKNAVKNRYIVVFHENTTRDYIDNLKNSLTLSKKDEAVHHTFKHLNAIAATLKLSNLAKLRKDPSVKYVEMDSIVKAFQSCTTQSDCGWCLQRVSNSSQSSNAYVHPQTSGEDVTCYVVDTGVNINHPDLQGRATRGSNFVSGEDANDRNGHGTAVSSLIAGKTCGTAKQAKIVGVKVLDKDGSGYNSDIIKGIDWCIKQRKKTGTETQIINLSLGGGYSKSTNDIVNMASDAGLLVVVAAGNSNTDSCEVSPASAESALTIGASDAGDYKAMFSNYGKCTKLFAPGVDCRYANAHNSQFSTGSGTSFAAPLVAGVAACYLAENRQLTSSALQLMLISRSRVDALKLLPGGTPNRFVAPLCA